MERAPLSGLWSGKPRVECKCPTIACPFRSVTYTAFVEIVGFRWERTSSEVAATMRRAVPAVGIVIEPVTVERGKWHARPSIRPGPARRGDWNSHLERKYPARSALELGFCSVMELVNAIAGLFHQLNEARCSPGGFAFCL